MNTQILTENQVDQAADLLRKGNLLGLPTETVYGLAANALNPQAVESIFKVKGRPSDNPLILHLANPQWVHRYCINIPDSFWLLSKEFWPGPITFILDRNQNIPDIVTAGLDTVGVRCPNHPLALAVLEKADIPVAAPSGNLSGKPSPTTAFAMYDDMNGKIPAILDGGACSVGVESTILDLRTTPVLLRFGGISVEEIQALLRESITIDPILLGKEEESSTPLAPGMKYRHYAPQAPVTIVVGKNSASWIASHGTKGDGVICFEEYTSLFTHFEVQTLGKETHFTEQAQLVFSALRYFDGTTVSRIWAQCPKAEGLGTAVANRLQKAAGFQMITLEDNT